MENRNYSVEIKYVSTEITKRTAVMLKDISNAIKLDEATAEGTVRVSPAMYAILGIHNEKAQDKDYENYIVVGADGNKYVTGSRSFWNSFMDIAKELEGEEYEIEIYRKDSKNYNGKQFITCSLI